jgi:uncharacterized protein (TIGR02271 family)
MHQQTLSLEQFETLRGADVYSQDGEKIGSVEQIFVDEQTRRPEWIGLGTGLFGTKRVIVPVEGASLSEDQVTVPYAKDHIKDSPEIDSDEISQETEKALYAHYGFGYSEARSDTGLPEGSGAASGDLAETMKEQAAVTRSEEQLRVGKQEEERDRLRLHKWVETEQVDVPVDVRREKARVTREPVDQAVTDQEIGEEELDVTLREERPVVEKETVAKEKIGIEKDVEVDQETVSGELRKERVEVDDESTR